MAQTYEKALAEGKLWLNRIRIANEHFSKWEKRFRCRELNDYYEGKQWKRDPQFQAFVLNLFHATIEIKQPALVFTRPEFYLTPRPGKSDFDPNSAFEKALLGSDTLNSILDQNNTAFTENVEMACLDAFSYFGVIEVGYDAKWIKNPNAGKPVFEADYDPDADPTEILKEPDELPETEWIYTKRIPAHRFRVGTNEGTELDKLNWIGYYEYIRITDIKAKGSGFRFSEKLEDSVKSTNEFIEERTSDSSEEPDQQEDLIKVWKIWDLRAKRFKIIPTKGEFVAIDEPFSRFPLFGLRFSKRRMGWYPIPLTYNWRSAQDEINESKEQLRTHRRRSKRIYQLQPGAMDEEERDKLINGPDGVTVTVKQGEIKPVQNTPVDNSVIQSMQISKTDFDAMSGTSAQDRGQADRTTATEIQSIAQKSQVRETKEREIVAKWLCQIGREVLLQAIERLSLPLWIKLNADPGMWGDEVASIQQQYAQIQTEWLEGFDFEVSLQIGSMSPIANDAELKAYLQFLAIMTQYPVIALSPELIMETAFRCGYRNLKVIRAWQQAAQLQMVGQIEQGKQNMMGQAGQTGSGGSIAQKTAAQMEPPQMAQIQNQLANQGVPGGVQGQ